MRKTLSTILIVSLVLILALSCSPEQSAPGPEVKLPSTEEIKERPKEGSAELLALDDIFATGKTDLMSFIGDETNLTKLTDELVPEINRRAANVKVEVTGSKMTIKTINKSFGFDYTEEESKEGEKTVTTKTLVKGNNTYKFVLTEENDAITGIDLFMDNKKVEDDSQIETISTLINEYSDKVMQELLITLNKGSITLLDGKLKIDGNFNLETKEVNITAVLENFEINESTYSAVAKLNINSSNGKFTLKASGNTSGKIGTHSVATLVQMSSEKELSVKLYIDNYIYMEMDAGI